MHSYSSMTSYKHTNKMFALIEASFHVKNMVLNIKLPNKFVWPFLGLFLSFIFLNRI